LLVIELNLFAVSGVRSWVAIELCPTKIDDPSNRLVKQLYIVTNDQDPAVVFCELFHQPTLRRYIEMVGRLVEDERVRRAVEHPNQLYPASLTTRKRLQVLEQQVLIQLDSVAQATDIGLGGVAAGVAEGHLQACKQLNVFARRVGLHRFARLREVVVDLIDAPCRQDMGEHRAVDA